MIKYLFFTLFMLPGYLVFGQLSVQDLTCEYLVNPSVVDETQPRLSWINTASVNQRGQGQTAYQIKVATSPAGLQHPDLWDSGKLTSDASSRVWYAGKALQSRQSCYWQVRVWDKDNKPSSWSKVASWHMGLLAKSDWKAEWIGAPWQGEEAIPKPKGGPAERTKILPPPAPLLRKAFTTTKKIKRAVVYTTGLGYFEFYVNGQKASDDYLVPNQTNYGKRPQLPEALISLPDEFRAYQVMYLAYDITARLRAGKNMIGAILGNGFYNDPKFWTASYGSPRFIAQLHLTYDDGTEAVIVSDKSWKAAKSAIISDLVYDGEIYDARQEQPDWCMPSYDDSKWESVVNRKAPYGELVAHTAPVDKITNVYQPVSVEKLANGNYKVMFPEEISGWVRLKNVTGPAGHTIKMTFNANQYSGENTYTFSGKKGESYAPRFNWFVFSGVEISNWPGELKAENIQAEAVNTAVTESAVFETSNQLFNQINTIWKRSQLDNMHGGIASDCPHRERSAYTGDAQVACQTVMHNFDVRAFYTKWMRDIVSAQIPATGYVPNGAPWQPGCGGGVAWGAAVQIIPWEFYQQYGDKDMLERSYEGMLGYIRYMQTWVNAEGIMHSQRTGKDGKPLQWWNLGEWAGLKTMPPNELVHTFYFWLCSDITAKTAAVLGKTAEAATYKALADKTRETFLTTFYDQQNGTFGKYGANIFALKMGVRPDQYPRVIQALKNDIAEAGGHLDTGIFGTRYFFEVLADNGLQALAYEAMNKTTEPSFGHWIALGSTTTREEWDTTGSHNHPMFGGGISWFYTRLAGLRSDDTQTGYRQLIVKPMPVADLTSAKYLTETPYGKAGVDWRKGTSFTMTVTVPVGSTAKVYIPAEKDQKITESNRPIQNRADLKLLTDEPGYQVVNVGSGRYTFTVQ
ncbi:family 78 glycoside hydrolase catalytic domain [Spirosoma gilvum]